LNPGQQQLPPLIADLGAAIAVSDLLGRSLLTDTKVVRVATICGLIQIAESPEMATQLLSDATGGIRFPEAAIDGAYQFNLRRPYVADPDIQMNRILNWSTASIQLITAQGIIGGPALTAVQTSLPVVVWRIDVNSATAADISPLALEMLTEQGEEVRTLVNSGTRHLF
jgi:hypothetical protein